jgi:hypothetical protein
MLIDLIPVFINLLDRLNFLLNYFFQTHNFMPLMLSKQSTISTNLFWMLNANQLDRPFMLATNHRVIIGICNNFNQILFQHTKQFIHFCAFLFELYLLLGITVIKTNWRAISNRCFPFLCLFFFFLLLLYAGLVEQLWLNVFD